MKQEHERISTQCTAGLKTEEYRMIQAVLHQHRVENTSQMFARLLILGALTYFERVPKGQLPGRDEMMEQIIEIMRKRAASRKLRA